MQMGDRLTMDIMTVVNPDISATAINNTDKLITNIHDCLQYSALFGVTSLITVLIKK